MSLLTYRQHKKDNQQLIMNSQKSLLEKIIKRKLASESAFDILTLFSPICSA